MSSKQYVLSSVSLDILTRCHFKQFRGIRSPSLLSPPGEGDRSSAPQAKSGCYFVFGFFVFREIKLMVSDGKLEVLPTLAVH